MKAGVNRRDATSRRRNRGGPRLSPAAAATNAACVWDFLRRALLSDVLRLGTAAVRLTVQPTCAPLLRTRMSALLAGIMFAFLFGGFPGLANPAPKAEPILLIVMDPLSKELACACVKGYGQRDYRKLAARLEKTIKQRVAIDFSDDLAESLSTINPGREVIVIGDQSLVSASAKKAAREFHPLCRLTDLNGSSDMT